MRRIEVFREGNAMGAMIGPDPVVGLSGFGETAADALRDLADEFEEKRLSLNVSTPWLWKSRADS